MAASKRVTKSVINWTSLAEKVPAKQREAFRVLKSATDKYVTKVSDLPETLPKIDFSEYRRRIGNVAMVQEFEKLYNTLEVPYPKDPENQSASIKKEEKEALQKRDTFIAEQNVHMKGLNDLLATIDSVPPPEKMTRQMFNHYFPDAAVNPNRDNPAVYPQWINRVQQDHPEFGTDYYNTSRNYRNIPSLAQWEESWRLHIEKKKVEKAKQLEAEKAKEIEGKKEK